MPHHQGTKFIMTLGPNGPWVIIEPCVKAFIKMNFKLNVNTKCWEHIADMYIWYNTEIIDPDTNSPFDNKKKPWSLIFADKLKFLYQLTNFKLGI